MMADDWSDRYELGGHDPNHPACANQLNISVHNALLTVDRRIEMGIIAQR